MLTHSTASVLWSHTLSPFHKQRNHPMPHHITSHHITSPGTPGTNRSTHRQMAVLQVPGTYMDALNPQSKLGKAIKGAVQELEQLNDMVGALCNLLLR